MESSKNGIDKMCDACNILMTINTSEGIYMCAQCGIVESFIIDHNRVWEDNIIKSYKRTNHLHELIKEHANKNKLEKDISSEDLAVKLSEHEKYKLMCPRYFKSSKKSDPKNKT
jgi:hypothetical protein